MEVHCGKVTQVGGEARCEPPRIRESATGTSVAMRGLIQRGAAAAPSAAGLGGSSDSTGLNTVYRLPQRNAVCPLKLCEYQGELMLGCWPAAVGKAGNRR